MINAHALEVRAIPKAVWLAIIVDVVLLTLLGIDRYVTYKSGVDLGLFTQSIVDAAHGMHNQMENGSHYVYHFSPALYVAYPLVAVLHSPIALILVQAIAGALVAPAIYLIARRRMDQELAVLAAIVSLCYPPLVGVTFTDFHENGLVPAAIAWLLWAVDTRRFGYAWIFAACALATKEDEAFILLVLSAGYCAWSAWRQDRKAALFGAGLCLASALVVAAYFAIVRPLVGGGKVWAPLLFHLTSGAQEAHGAQAVISRISYLVEVFLPLLFLPLRSWSIVLALPGLAECLGSRWSIAHTMGQHYAGVWISYVLVAFVSALAKIGRTHRDRAKRWVVGSLVICALILILASPTHWGHFLGPRTAHDAVLDRVLRQIPYRASVGSVDEIYVHVSLNSNAHPGYPSGTEYLIVDDAYDSAIWRATYRPQLEDRLKSGDYQLVLDDSGVRLYRLRQ